MPQAHTRPLRFPDLVSGSRKDAVEKETLTRQNQGGQQIEKEYRCLSFSSIYATPRATQVGSVVKNPSASAGDSSSIPGGRSPREGNGK